MTINWYSTVQYIWILRKFSDVKSIGNQNWLYAKMELLLYLKFEVNVKNITVLLKIKIMLVMNVQVYCKLYVILGLNVELQLKVEMNKHVRAEGQDIVE